MSRPDLSSRIFVGGLDHSVDEGDLKKAFQIFGDVTNIMVLRDKETGRSRGFAFVSFKDSRSSEDAIRRMHGVEIRGRCVSVRHAEKEKSFDGPPRRPGRGRGGSFSRGRSDMQYSNNGYPRGGGSYTGVSNRGGYSGRDTYNKGRGRDDFRGGRDDFLDNRDDYRRRRDDYHDTGNSFPSRSRSPLGGGMSSSYRDDSPPTRGRNHSDKRYSPVRRGNSPRSGDYSQEDVYYGASKQAREYSPVHNRSVSHGLSPSRDNYSSYGSSMQQLSPARERNAYVSSRGRDSLSPPHSNYRSNAGMRMPRSDSPVSGPPHRSDLDYEEYGSSRSREHDGGSYNQDSYRASSNRSSGGKREYRNTSSNIREHKRGGYSSRSNEVSSSSRYNRHESNRYGSASRMDGGRMSSPGYKRSSGSGGPRISSRPLRHTSPGFDNGGSHRY